MSLIPKTYLGIFLIFLGVLVLTGVVVANLDVTAAQSFHADVIDEIENSNFAPSVISACESSATNAGYTLDCTEFKDAEGETIMVEVVLKYKYSIPFLNHISQHEKRGYAR